MNRYQLTEYYTAELEFHNHYGYDKTFPLSFTNVVQLDSKQAWILRDVDGNLFLQSYSTIVSIKWADTHDFMRLGRFSVTTSKHQTLFERKF